MDVPFHMQLQREFERGLDRVLFFYDVNCNYNINAYERCVKNGDSPLSPKFHHWLKRELGKVLPKVNQWHLGSHKLTCADEYGTRYTPRTAHRHGEEVESTWSHMDKEQWATREMDAGAREDTLSIHMHYNNAEKIKKMRACSPGFLTKLTKVASKPAARAVLRSCWISERMQ